MTHRRHFLQTTAIAGTALAAGRTARALPANEVRLGCVGCGGRAQGLINAFADIDGVSIAAAYDPDEARRGGLSERFGAEQVSDLRRIMDDPSIDAVVVATPDHWHTPAALLALQAGKHVYVEKPCSHNVREGRWLTDTARLLVRHVQHGTQSRSMRLARQAIELLRSGVIGTVRVAKAWNVQRRGNIGHAAPGQPPAGFDYDTWVGPAPMVPFQSNRHHYTWHWWHAFGTGDTGNDGVHELDIARWGLGVDEHPHRVSAVGGKYSFDDDQEFPDTQAVCFDYLGDGSQNQRRQLLFEMRLWSRYGLEGVDNGNAFYGEKGWMLFSKRGILRVFDEQNRPVDVELPEIDEGNHYANFIETIRGNETLNAEIGEGHLSATLCHLANLSTRLGRSIDFDGEREACVDEEADRGLGREYRDHWSRPQAPIIF